MSFVIDASVAIKWVIEEDGTEEALDLLPRKRIAPDLIIAECANILWKKARRGEITPPEAHFAGRLLGRASVELIPTRPLLDRALEIGLLLDHAAYDCFYLALAEREGISLVTADARLTRKVTESALAITVEGLVGRLD